MRVGVNLLWMVPGEVGGSETWMSGLLGHLATHRPAHEVVLFAPDAVVEAHPELAPLEVVRAPDRVGRRSTAGTRQPAASWRTCRAAPFPVCCRSRA